MARWWDVQARGRATRRWGAVRRRLGVEGLELRRLLAVAIADALRRLGHSVADVRAGKIFFVEIVGRDRAAAESEARRMAEELLANTVIEGYDVIVRD